MARKTPDVNAGSMADIAFLLLIFFLVTTSMNVDSGIQRILPPMADQPEQKGVDVKERNIMQVLVSKSDQLLVQGQLLDLSQLKDKALEFVLNAANREDLPEKKNEEIELIGTFPVSQGVISLQNDRATSYNMYIKVQDELTRAFNDAREIVSVQFFGKKFSELDEPSRQAVQKAIPLKISEAEPRNMEGGKK